MPRTAWLLASTLLALAPLAGGAETSAARPSEPKAASPDTELLEFLGSGDDADADFQEYVAQPVTPPRAVAAVPKARS